jgi:hypothetical protein
MSYTITQTVRQKTLQALKYQLQQIQEGNLCKVSLLTVVIGLAQRTAVTLWPACIIVKGKERVINEDMSDQLLHKDWFLTLLIYDKPENQGAEEAEDFQERALADIEKMIGQRFNLPGADGLGTCFIARVMGSEPFNKLDGQNFAGIGVHLRIRYRQDEQDPTMQG